MVRKMRPTAVTLDLGLSDIDGFVLLDLLRHEPEIPDIPVYVISGAEQAAHALTWARPSNRETRRAARSCSSCSARSRELPAAGKPKRRKRGKAQPGADRLGELAGTDC